jgi:hypothetical protein
VVALGVSACGRKATTNATPSQTAAPSQTASATAPPSPISAPKRCSILMLRGTADIQEWDPRDVVVRPKPGEPIPDNTVFRVANGSDLTVRTATNREITIVGPANAEVCPEGEDVVRLARGAVSAFPGIGVRPGVEVWVATPLGVVRFSDAKIEVEVTTVAGASIMKANAAIAAAEFLPAPGVRVRVGAPDANAADAAPWQSIAIPAGTTLLAERRQVPSSFAELVRACAKESDVVVKAAADLAARKTDLGDLAAAHIRAQRHARTVCETAHAKAVSMTGALDGSLWTELLAADEKRNQLTPLPARR